MNLLEQVIEKKIKLGCTDRYDALCDIQMSLRTTSPWEFAKMFGVLVDESAEEFMLQFMPAYNNEVQYWY
jgi:hypothetical protein